MISLSREQRWRQGWLVVNLSEHGWPVLKESNEDQPPIFLLFEFPIGNLTRLSYSKCSLVLFSCASKRFLNDSSRQVTLHYIPSLTAGITPGQKPALGLHSNDFHSKGIPIRLLISLCTPPLFFCSCLRIHLISRFLFNLHLY